MDRTVWNHIVGIKKGKTLTENGCVSGQRPNYWVGSVISQCELQKQNKKNEKKNCCLQDAYLGRFLEGFTN